MKEKFNTDQMRNQCVDVARGQWCDNNERKDALAELNKSRWEDVDYRDTVRAKISFAHGGSGDIRIIDGANRSKSNYWSIAVKKRDNYKCVECDSSENLHSHHIKPKSLYPELRYDLDNGVTLCKSCHFKIHFG